MEAGGRCRLMEVGVCERSDGGMRHEGDGGV